MFLPLGQSLQLLRKLGGKKYHFANDTFWPFHVQRRLKIRYGRLIWLQLVKQQKFQNHNIIFVEYCNCVFV